MNSFTSCLFVYLFGIIKGDKMKIKRGLTVSAAKRSPKPAPSLINSSKQQFKFVVQLAAIVLSLFPSTTSVRIVTQTQSVTKRNEKDKKKSIKRKIILF